MAPTILAAAGCAVPSDMEGDVLPIVDDPVETREPITLADGAEREAAGVEDRLKQLGYME